MFYIIHLVVKNNLWLNAETKSFDLIADDSYHK